MDTIIIKARLNGNRGRDDNPNVPWTPKEVAEEAVRCHDAGAFSQSSHTEEQSLVAVPNRFEGPWLSTAKSSSIAVSPLYHAVLDCDVASEVIPIMRSFSNLDLIGIVVDVHICPLLGENLATQSSRSFESLPESGRLFQFRRR